MHEKSLVTLEYPKIAAKLAAEAAFSASKDLARELRPSTDPTQVRRRLALTTEARKLLDLRADAGVRSAKDVRPQVTAAARGIILSPSELLAILATLRSSAHVSRLIARLDDGFPLLKGLAEDLPLRPKLEGRIAESIGEEGDILDAASPELRRLRAEIRGAQQRLQERLGTLVNEFRAALQEPIITMRADRYVLPVRAEARGQVRGIVHDQSSSGATVFVEPLVVVEMNNRLRQLQIAEQQEIERILAELAEAVGLEASTLTLAVELLAEIDLQFAKARYASLLRAGLPSINTEGRLRLRQARHPLLTGQVVPIDFWLGGEQARMVVITGPNTGGKTVALKTVGLLCLMAQAGMHVPAEDGSELPIFADIFADIGDEQSIEQSLSTFSSHLTRIVEILGLAGPRALVLLDELGAGTDPSEGSALAQAILSYLLERDTAVVATTHYSELKAFAHEEPGATNASVEFDVETLSPTYRLSIGLPGRSNALAIATRLGLPEEIIARARARVGSAGVAMEDLLEGLAAEHKAVADERYRLSMERAEAEYQRREMERRQVEAEEERMRILNEAREQVRRELEQARAELGRVRAQLRRHGPGEEQLAELRASINRLEERSAPVAPKRGIVRRQPHEGAEGGAPAVGDSVYVRSMDAHGELLATANASGNVEVRLGALKVRLPADNVARVSNRQARTEQATVAISLPSRPDVETPHLQLDLRGWRVEDGLEEVERYLHDAFMAGMPFVRILHGKGTGALRQAIRQQLARNPMVTSFQSAEARDGGEGITIVTLAS